MQVLNLLFVSFFWIYNVNLYLHFILYHLSSTTMSCIVILARALSVQTGSTPDSCIDREVTKLSNTTIE